MKVFKIENSYDLGESFSNVSREGAWKKIINYLNSNKSLLNKLSFYKNSYTATFQSFNQDNLISIINPVELNESFHNMLIRTIKLNLKFNKETKNLEIDNNLNEKYNDINSIIYSVSHENDLKNDVYFSEDSILINYENINASEINNSEYAICILFFNKTKILKNQNNEVILEDTSLEHMLLIYNRKTDKLKFIEFEKLNTDNKMFDLSKFITKYNNNENINEEEFNVNDNPFSYNFSNFKLSKSIILLNEATEDAVLFFKNGLNKYIFDNFIKLQYERNSEEIN